MDNSTLDRTAIIKRKMKDSYDAICGSEKTCLNLDKSTILDQAGYYLHLEKDPAIQRIKSIWGYAEYETRFPVVLLRAMVRNFPEKRQLTADDILCTHYEDRTAEVTRSLVKMTKASMGFWESLSKEIQAKAISDEVGKYIHLEEDPLIVDNMKKKWGYKVYNLRFPVLLGMALVKNLQKNEVTTAADLLQVHNEDIKGVQAQYCKVFSSGEQLQVADVLALDNKYSQNPHIFLFVTDKRIFVYKAGIMGKVETIAEMQSNENLIQHVEPPRLRKTGYWPYQLPPNYIDEGHYFFSSPHSIWLTDRQIIVLTYDVNFECTNHLSMPLQEDEKVIDSVGFEQLFIVTNRRLIYFNVRWDNRIETQNFWWNESPSVVIDAPRKKKLFSISSNKHHLHVECKGSAVAFQINLETYSWSYQRLTSYVKDFSQ